MIDESTPARPRRLKARHVAGLALGAAGALAMAASPAGAHASFPGYAGFGFAPNTAGGTGATGSTPPYAGLSNQTIFARVPFEQTEFFNGSDDTTVDLKVVVPAGWTNPGCGDALTQVNDASTNNTNQPGSVVPGWSCQVETEAGTGHQVVHFSGPQVVAPATYLDSPQYFSFTVTTPNPTVQTTYNGTNGTEGFIIDQTYASGEISHWIPNAAYPGVTPAGANTSVASGLARTVAPK